MTSFDQLAQTSSNPLRDYFLAHKTGPGIFKWLHYFEIYHRHLEKFRERDVHVLEIGVGGGGSLGMWRDYFGRNSTIYGVDIEPSRRVHENARTRIFIGDQGDQAFWRDFKMQVPQVDVVVDDGSHIPEHQILSFQELFPVLSPGGVYICEDIHGLENRFAQFVYGLADTLNEGSPIFDRNPQRRHSITINVSQATIERVSLYPLVAVIDKRASPLSELVASVRGT